MKSGTKQSQKILNACLNRNVLIADVIRAAAGTYCIA